jgi:hypothetical protein
MFAAADVSPTLGHGLAAAKWVEHVPFPQSASSYRNVSVPKFARSLNPPAFSGAQTISS